ncbi:Asp/Glu/hydantoin racemase [Scheffersomyces xylosifermentans]|uniref:Asp/Glu/hydantoin racemase n=1 Tax=Scheffersomyces xylosifermentans TaxID=1304137 RepID=UPI00315D9C2B
MVLNLLIINPNSSESVTANLAATVKEPESVKLHFYTGPANSPTEITPETSNASEQAVLPDLLAKNAIEKYDGFLVCCYSDHPLVGSLKKHTKKPVLGIMQATLLYALSTPLAGKSFILTSVNEWESILDKGIVDFLGNEENIFPSKKFQRTKGLDVSVLGLSNPKEFKKIYDRVDSILNKEYKDDHIHTVLLGCAGMAGLDDKLSASFPGVKFVDSVKIGVEFLASLCRFG